MPWDYSLIDGSIKGIENAAISFIAASHKTQSPFLIATKSASELTVM